MPDDGEVRTGALAWWTGAAAGAALGAGTAGTVVLACVGGVVGAVTGVTAEAKVEADTVSGAGDAVTSEDSRQLASE